MDKETWTMPDRHPGKELVPELNSIAFCSVTQVTTMCIIRGQQDCTIQRPTELYNTGANRTVQYRGQQDCTIQRPTGLYNTEANRTVQYRGKQDCTTQRPTGLYNQTQAIRTVQSDTGQQDCTVKQRPTGLSNETEANRNV